MPETIPIFVGFDQREAVAYHTFCQSVIEHVSVPVAFHPLALRTLPQYTERHTDGSNQFIYSRFLVPSLMNYKGWAIFVDGDMVCRSDIAKLWAMRDPNKAVMVAKHEYRTRYPVKYLGAPNVDYPRKNWSSVILWNCGHPANFVLLPGMVEAAAGKYLHRFAWLDDSLIGDIPLSWNWLAGEYPANDAHLIHYTIGTPCFAGYRDFDMAEHWHAAHRRANHAEDDHAVHQ